MSSRRKDWQTSAVPWPAGKLCVVASVRGQPVVLPPSKPARGGGNKFELEGYLRIVRQSCFTESSMESQGLHSGPPTASNRDVYPIIRGWWAGRKRVLPSSGANDLQGILCGSILLVRFPRRPPTLHPELGNERPSQAGIEAEGVLHYATMVGCLRT